MPLGFEVLIPCDIPACGILASSSWAQVEPVRPVHSRPVSFRDVGGAPVVCCVASLAILPRSMQLPHFDS